MDTVSFFYTYVIDMRNLPEKKDKSKAYVNSRVKLLLLNDANPTLRTASLQ